MKKCLLVLSLFFLISMPAAHANEISNFDSTAIRQEFDSLFGQVKIYQAIKKYLPHHYEELFRSYEAAKRSNNMGEFKLSRFINSIRSSYLKQSSDQTILDFYRHIIHNGRTLLSRDTDAAFAYLFGGNSGSYSAYVDYQTELDFLGELFERILATSQPENATAIDREDVEVTLNMIYLDLYQRFGEQLFLLHHPDHSQLNPTERYQLCDIYLCMHEEIFNLGHPTRDYVLRSFAMKL